MGQGHNTQGSADVETINMSVSHSVNTWQGRQVAPEAVLGNSTSDFETKAPHNSTATYCKMHNIGLQLTLTGGDLWNTFKYIEYFGVSAFYDVRCEVLAAHVLSILVFQDVMKFRLLIVTNISKHCSAFIFWARLLGPEDAGDMILDDVGNC